MLATVSILFDMSTIIDCGKQSITKIVSDGQQLVNSVDKLYVYVDKHTYKYVAGYDNVVPIVVDLGSMVLKNVDLTRGCTLSHSKNQGKDNEYYMSLMQLKYSVVSDIQCRIGNVDHIKFVDYGIYKAVGGSIRDIESLPLDRNLYVGRLDNKKAMTTEIEQYNSLQFYLMGGLFWGPSHLMCELAGSSVSFFDMMCKTKKIVVNDEQSLTYWVSNKLHNGFDRIRFVQSDYSTVITNANSLVRKSAFHDETSNAIKKFACESEKKAWSRSCSDSI